MPNDQQSIDDRFHAVIAAIHASDALAIVDQKEDPLPENARPPQRTLEKIAKHAKIELDPSISRCFTSFITLAVAWRHRDKATNIAGEFSLKNLYSAISNPPKLWDDNMPPNEQELLKTLRVIDDHPYGGRGTLGALQIEPGVTSPRLWFVNIKREHVPLDVDYCGYVEALLTTKGFYGWQYLFADVDLTADENRGLRRDLEQMLTFLPTAFPDQAYEPLQRRLAERTGKTGSR